MAEMWDYTSAPMSYSAMKKAGCAVASRYLSPSSYGTWKNLSATEAGGLKANGFDIVSNWEGYADFRTDPRYTTEASGDPHSMGRLDGREAYQQHHACGGPDWAAIKFSFDVPGLDGPTCEKYILGVLSLDLPFYPDWYAKHAVLDYLRTSAALKNLVRRAPWMTSSWNYNAGVAPDAALHQYGYMGSYDKNHILKSYYGGWSQAGKHITPSQVAEEDDMYIVEVDKNTVPAGKQWPGDFLLTSMGTLVHIEPAQKKNDGSGVSSNIDGLTAAGVPGASGGKAKGWITYSQYEKMTVTGAIQPALNLTANTEEESEQGMVNPPASTTKRTTTRKAGGKQ